MKNFIQKRVLPICLMLALCLSILPSVAFAADNATNIASSGYMTGGGAWAYTADKVYNSEVSIMFNLSAQLEGGNWVDFALRGNSQNAGDWFSYQNGLVLRLYADATWGTYFKVGYGGGDVWFDADFGESALKYTDVDFTQKHTVSYSVQDVYENNVFQGIRIDVKLDDAVVNFTNMNNAGYQSTSDGSYIMIPASYLETAPAEHFTSSYLFAWGNGKGITVTEAYLKHIEAEDEPVIPEEPRENIASSGIMTGGGAWAYTAEKMYNSEVTIKFKLSSQLEGGNWVDFALRGNSQDAGDWFSYQNGLVLRLYADPTWGTYFKIGYGGGDVWFDAAYGESALKYTDVDFSQEHTVTYSVQDVYENDVFQGIRIDVKLDDAVVNFTTSEGSYVMIPASSVESAPAEHFTESYLFAWGNGKSITVTEAYLEQLDANDEPVVPEEPKENIASSGLVTPGNAWVYISDKMYNSEVSFKFNLSAQLEGGNWIDFALRGNSQDAGAWFSYQNGLVLRLYADPTWGTYFKVGYGGGDGWFDADFGESALKYTNVDFSQEHTVTYSVQDVYENDVFQGVRIDVKLDDAVVNFNTSEGSYVMIPASALATAPAEHFTESYPFAWANGKTITVTEAYLEQFGTNDEPETPVVSQWNITLGDSIGVKFELNLAEGDTVAAFIGKNEIDSVYADGKLSVKLAAAQMADEIIIKINGEALDKTYSVRGYADYILDDANGFNDSAKALVKAMLNYGAASQTYFDYNTGNLANAGIDVTAAAVPTEGGKFDISGSVEGLAFYGASLVHKDKIAVRFYFTGSVDGIDFGAYTVNENNGMYYIEIADINPQDLDKDITVTVNNSLTISYSPLDYIIRIYAKGGNSAALVQALYSYYLAAANYTPA